MARCIWCLLVVAVVVLSQLASTVRATILVDQHPATTDAANAMRTNLPGPETNQQVADDFSLALAADLTEISWSGYYFGTAIPGSEPSVDFTVRLFSGSTPPVAPLFSELIAATFIQTGSTAGFGDPIYRFSASLASPVSLSDSVTYWLSVLDSDASTTVDFRWLRAADVFNSAAAYRSTEGTAWYPTYADFALSLSGTVVPEPSAFMLLAVGTLACVAVRRLGVSR